MDSLFFPIILISNIYFSLSCSKLLLFDRIYPMNILRNIASQPLYSTVRHFSSWLTGFLKFWLNVEKHCPFKQCIQNLPAYILEILNPMNFTSIRILLFIMVKNWDFPIPRSIIIFKEFYGRIIHIQKCIFQTCIVWVFWAKQAISRVWDKEHYKHPRYPFSHYFSDNETHVQLILTML